jgi:hypothetical protein
LQTLELKRQHLFFRHALSEAFLGKRGCLETGLGLITEIGFA